MLKGEKMTRKGNFILRELADEYVLVPCKETTECVNKVITLSETAAFIYKHLEEAATAQEMAQMVGKQYQIGAADVQEDVDAVLKAFRDNGLIE